MNLSEEKLSKHPKKTSSQEWGHMGVGMDEVPDGDRWSIHLSLIDHLLGPLPMVLSLTVPHHQPGGQAIMCSWRQLAICSTSFVVRLFCHQAPSEYLSSGWHFEKALTNFARVTSCVGLSWWTHIIIFRQLVPVGSQTTFVYFSFQPFSFASFWDLEHYLPNLPRWCMLHRLHGLSTYLLPKVYLYLMSFHFQFQLWVRVLLDALSCTRRTPVSVSVCTNGGQKLYCDTYCTSFVW